MTPVRVSVRDEQGTLVGVVSLIGPPLIAGRLADSSLLLESELVSRRHARFQRDGIDVLVTDLGGVSGTWLDGERLPALVPTPWTLGQLLQIGPFFLQLEPSAAAPEARPRSGSDIADQTVAVPSGPRQPPPRLRTSVLPSAAPSVPIAQAAATQRSGVSPVHSAPLLPGVPVPPALSSAGSSVPPVRSAPLLPGTPVPPALSSAGSSLVDAAAAPARRVFTTWVQHAILAVLSWIPSPWLRAVLAPHLRAAVADSASAVTAAVSRSARGQPPATSAAPLPPSATAAAPLPPPTPLHPGPAGDFTIALAQKLRHDEAAPDELDALLQDDRRVGRMVGTGILTDRDARMIQSASASQARSRRRARRILAVVCAVAAVLIIALAAQNLAYRSRLKQQEALFGQVQQLEQQLKASTAPGQPPDEEKIEAVARLRAAERELMALRSKLAAKDRIVTYRNPLGQDVQQALEGFGKQNYVVPDDFIALVEKHIRSLTRSSSRAILAESFANAPKYRPLIEGALKQAGMPLPFFYLAMHESKLDNGIVSATGARGLWQFVPSTAREYGLKVPADWRELELSADERSDPQKSTQAAIRFLKHLMAELGDVALAMTAYNAGGGAVRSALRRVSDPINNRDFWFVYRMGTLSEEANEYVPKIIATMIIDQHRARYGFGP